MTLDQYWVSRAAQSPFPLTTSHRMKVCALTLRLLLLPLHPAGEQEKTLNSSDEEWLANFSLQARRPVSVPPAASSTLAV